MSMSKPKRLPAVLGDSASTTGTGLLLTQLHNTERRVRDMYAKSVALGQMLGYIPKEVADVYNQSRDSHVSTALPVAKTLNSMMVSEGYSPQLLDLPYRIEPLTSSGSTVATASLPASTLTTVTVAGSAYPSIAPPGAILMSAIKFTRPEMNEATTAIPVAEPDATGAGLGFGLPELIILGIIVIAVGIAVVLYEKYKHSAEVAQAAVQISANERLAKVQQRALDVLVVGFNGCMSKAGNASDAAKCQAQANKGAGDIAKIQPPPPPTASSWGFLTYVGLFVVVTGVALGGYYIYKRRHEIRGYFPSRKAPELSPSPEMEPV